MAGVDHHGYLAPTLGFAGDLPHDLQDRLARENGIIAGCAQKPLMPEGPLPVHEEERAVGVGLRRGEDPVLLDGRELGGVAEKRVW
jgi:hypothetical protein